MCSNSIIMIAIILNDPVCVKRVTVLSEILCVHFTEGIRNLHQVHLGLQGI